MLVLGALAVVLIGKPMVALLFVWLMRYPFRTALTAGIALSQIGEFSFILASVGRGLGVLPAEATNILVATAITSIVLNPMAYRAIGPIERWAAARPGLWRIVNRPKSVPADLESAPVERGVDPAHRAVVVGFGPTGRTVVRLLQENGVRPTVIELNMDAARALKHEGIDAVYGDATRVETLEAAGVAEARSLILGSAGMANSSEVIRGARSLNAEIRVLARASYVRDVAGLKHAGADRIYAGESEVALAFIEDILGSLGATAEQIERERARAREELASPHPGRT
jgi:CPA2 family monovalent cation:H+ antiporter-2